MLSDTAAGRAPFDGDDAAALANRLQDVIRSLPQDTHPTTIMVAICMMLGRAIQLVDPSDRQTLFAWTISVIREEAQLDLIN